MQDWCTEDLMGLDDMDWSSMSAPSCAPPIHGTASWSWPQATPMEDSFFKGCQEKGCHNEMTRRFLEDAHDRQFTPDKTFLEDLRMQYGLGPRGCSKKCPKSSASFITALNDRDPIEAPY